MKKRKGFVGNSSVSSFTCDICGDTAAGHSMGLSDIDWKQCLEWHEICYGCLREFGVTERSEEFYIEKFGEDYDLNPAYDEYIEEMEEENAYVPVDLCPVCSFDVPHNPTLKRYFLKTTDITTDEVFAVVKAGNRRRKKLYDAEYVMYVVTKLGIDLSLLLQRFKEEFGTISKLNESLEQK